MQLYIFFFSKVLMYKSNTKVAGQNVREYHRQCSIPCNKVFSWCEKMVHSMLKIKNTCQESALVTLFNLHTAETINRKMRQLSSPCIRGHAWFLLRIHPSRILKKYCTCKQHSRHECPSRAASKSRAAFFFSFFFLGAVRQSWENGSSVSHRLMFNKEAFVRAADQEFSWTMTLDGSDPLPAKQWFCFKFLCHACFVRWGCPGPQSGVMRLD